MIEKPEIVRTIHQRTAMIHLTVSRAEIQQAMGPAIGEIMAAVAAQGRIPEGPIYSHHLRMAPDVFDFEVGVPVSGVITPTGRVVAGELPATRVARTVYRGGYEGLGAAWGEFEAWIAGQGLKSAPDFWECYTSGPESSPDPANWRTEFNRPLLGA